jgi:hypothetical protein
MGRTKLRLVPLLTAASLVLGLPGIGIAEAAGKTNAVKVGTFSFTGLGTGSAAGAGGAQAGPPHEPMNKTLRHTTASQVPSIAGASIASGAGGASGFNGLDDFQQTNAGTGSYANSQFDVTPPDQGLCVGNGYVVEGVNDALRVYSTRGGALTPAVALNQFAQTTPESVNGGPPFGEFLSDPKCYYDPDTAHWFMTFLGIALDPSTGNFGNSARQFIAVSQGSNPTKSWTIYAFPTTDDGTSGTVSDPGCPCFGDQPLLGADANGVYITTNEYSINGPAYNGAQLYAMSKQGLETGRNTAVTQLQPGMSSSVTNTLGGVAFSIQPATSPNSGYATAANGTEYFQSALDFGAAPALGTRADRIAVWNLTNTASLNSTDPDPALHVAVVPSEEYTQPPNATQAPGTLVINNNLPLVAANDDRMNQVVYAGGHLWSGVNTAVQTPQGPTLAGLAWFVTSPSTSPTGAVSASLVKQGYLGVNKEDLLFPSIGVTPAGHAVMAFTLVGPNYHPSAAWSPLSLSSGTGPIYVAAAGQNAVDDFSSLKAYLGDGVDRWGDYTAAVSDSSGNVWMGVEYISGIERTYFANWATYLFHVSP